MSAAFTNIRYSYMVHIIYRKRNYILRKESNVYNE